MFGSEVMERLADAVESQDWHWYCWHVSEYRQGRVTPFFFELVTALGIIDVRMPEAAIRIIDRIGAIGGENRNQDDYDQLYQILAEVNVLLKICAFPWDQSAVFEYEPVIVGGGSNPEMVVTVNGRALAIEVKAPIVRHYRNNMPAGLQATARVYDPNSGAIAALPRDNPIKDALASADKKFADMRTQRQNVVSVLAIVWDAAMHEPISSLVHEASGLFTPNTFDPEKRVFADVDAVVILPHARQLIEGPGNRRFIDATGAFSWVEFPFRPYLLNPNSPRQDVTTELNEIFESRDQRGILGAEYAAVDGVLWIDT